MNDSFYVLYYLIDYIYIIIFDFKDGNVGPNHVTVTAFIARFLIHRSDAVAGIINYVTSPAWGH